jgi:hypothetical protein
MSRVFLRARSQSIEALLRIEATNWTVNVSLKTIVCPKYCREISGTHRSRRWCATCPKYCRRSDILCVAGDANIAGDDGKERVVSE